MADKINVHEERVCELHFEPTAFLNDYRNRLHQTAIPTQYLDAPPAKPNPTRNRPVPKLNPMHSVVSPVSSITTPRQYIIQKNLNINFYILCFCSQMIIIHNIKK